MALYLIGDIQGCDEPLQRLLQTIDFSPSRDTLYLLGDLVNRGPDSLAVLLDEDDFLSNEEFGYVAGEVYENKTGNGIPRDEASHPADPAGEEWDFDDEDLCAAKLPKLWAKFGA